MTPDGKTAGIFLVVSTMFFFSLMDIGAKTLALRVDIVQTIWARYVAQASLVVLILLPRLRSIAKTERLGLQFLRSAFLLGATCFFFAAISQIPIADATAIMNLSPVMITLGAAVFLGERFGIRRAFAIGAGLLGSILIIRPGSDVFVPAAVLPIFGAACYAGYVLTTRAAGQSESVWTSLLYTALVGAVVMSVAVVFVWQPMDTVSLLIMATMGVLGTLGQLCLIRAFSLAEASVLAPFTYCGLLFAMGWGILLFDEFPDLTTYLGAGIIVCAGLYVWHRETSRPETKSEPSRG